MTNFDILKIDKTVNNDILFILLYILKRKLYKLIRNINMNISRSHYCFYVQQ